MSHQLTITVSDEIYQGLQTAAGDRTISELIEELARPVVAEANLEAAYLEMSKDTQREAEALAWADGLVQDALGNGEHVPG
jgi:predicted CopG family antitoxin